MCGVYKTSYYSTKVERLHKGVCSLIAVGAWQHIIKNMIQVPILNCCSILISGQQSKWYQHSRVCNKILWLVRLIGYLYIVIIQRTYKYLYLIYYVSLLQIGHNSELTNYDVVCQNRIQNDLYVILYIVIIYHLNQQVGTYISSTEQSILQRDNRLFHIIFQR